MFSTKNLCLLAVSVLLRPVVSIAIVDFDSCPIPYLIPRAFQTTCDPADQHITEEMLPLKVTSGYKGRVLPAWISNKYIRTTPDIWSHEPFCLITTGEKKMEVCAYTSTTFANGRGISFVIEPVEIPRVSLASSIRLQHNYTFAEWVNPLNDSRMVKVPIEGKGLGVRSQAFLRRGDAAQSYTPVMAIQDTVMQLPLNTVDQNLPLEVAMQRLPDYARTIFVELYGQFGGNPNYDKVNTNAFNAMIGKSQEFFWSVYPETSRFNHDCRPNTMYSVDEDDLLHNLRVGRNIIPGEEVTLSYLAPNMRSPERKVRMKSQWGFECSCSLCKSPPHVLAASDERVTLIDELETELNDLSPERNASVSTAELLIELHKQEHLDGVIGDAYMYAAFEHAYLGDKRRVQMYASRAVEHMAIWRGTNHGYYMAMLRLMFNTENEKSWLYFKKLAQKEKAANAE